MRVAGYFEGAMGTGEHARQLVAALHTQRIPIDAWTLHPDRAPEARELAAGDRTHATRHGSNPHAFEDFNLLCVNADQVPVAAAQLGEAFFSDRRTIGFWAWEVSSFPAAFLTGFDWLDELWVGSRHVRDAMAPLAPVPVVVIPQPISLPSDAANAEPLPGVPDGFRFLFAFDYLSVFERKNPLAVIEAFTGAFAPGSGSALIIKSINDDFDPAAHERLRAAAASHPDVHLIERLLSRGDRTALINAADCYVSLHRAEGFGYTMAEAMWLGKPVIATGYSGNLDFMTAENGHLVDHRLVPIGPGNDPYPPDALWAEPDVEHASRVMRRVVDAPAESSALGRRAAADIRLSHAPDVAGRAIVERLTELAASPRVRRPRARRPATARTRLSDLAGRVRRLQGRLRGMRAHAG